MIRKLITLSLVLFTYSILDASASHTMQVTIGASTTQVITTSTYARHLMFQNNQTHNMRVGDSNTTSSRGALLASGSPGGSMSIGPNTQSNIDIATFWVNGTQNDVLDVVWVD